MSKKWYVEFYFDDIRIQIWSGRKFGLKSGGNNIQRKKERRLYYQELAKLVLEQLKKGWIPIKIEDEKLTAIELINKGIEYKKSNSTETNNEYRDRIGRFTAFLREKKIEEFNRIDKKIILEFLKSFNGHNHNNYLRVIKAIFSELLEKELILDNPALGIKKVKSQTTTHKIYPTKEMKRILDYTTKYPYVKIILLMEYYQFARPSEVMRIKTEHIKFDEKKLILVQKKGNQEKIRIMPLHPVVEEELKKMDLTEEYLFKNRKKYWIRAAWDRIRKKLELEKGYTIYGFKHTGVCSLYKATKDIYLVSKLCGHESISTTEIYLKSLGQDVHFLDNSKIPEI